MTLAEELVNKYLPNAESWQFAQVTKRNMQSAINEAIERCIAEVDSYKNNVCNDAEPGQHAKAACGFIAHRLRALKG